jgi:hypothetical protein
MNDVRHCCNCEKDQSDSDKDEGACFHVTHGRWLTVLISHKLFPLLDVFSSWMRVHSPPKPQC